MPQARRTRAPKLEPELLDRARGTASVSGAMSPPRSSNRVSGASVSQPATVGRATPITVELCDGSQFTFARLIDLPTEADA
jgi:hypothetical protein